MVKPENRGEEQFPVTSPGVSRSVTDGLIAGGADCAGEACGEAGTDERLSPEVYLVTGPTACGKGVVARCLAGMMDAEIVVVDSMKVYRGMDIGTAKAPLALRVAIRHWMTDVADPWESFTLARYLEGAESAIAAIARSGRRPLLAGGTPLYIRGLLYGIFHGPAADWDLRKRLQDRAAAEGAASLHDELKLVDPAAAARIHPNDLRRVVRALEVYQNTGARLSEQQREYPAAKPKLRAMTVVLERERQDLRRRIRRRVDCMVRRGLFEEVERLLASPRGLARAPRQAVGYKEVIAHLAGRCSAAEAVDAVLRNTWRLARKQMTWFRSFAHAPRLPVAAEEKPETTAHRVRDSFTQQAAAMG